MLTLALYSPDEESDPATARTWRGSPSWSRSRTARGVLEVAVHPSYRNQGVADRLVGTLKSARGFDGLKAWSHGNHEAAAELAAKYGYPPVREFWKMRLDHIGRRTAPRRRLPDT